MREAFEQKVAVILGKKIWVIVGGICAVIGSIVVPGLSGYAAYYKSMQAMDDKINSARLEAAKTLMTKEDAAEIKSQLVILHQWQIDNSKEMGKLIGQVEGLKKK